MPTSYVEPGYLADELYVYQPVATSMTTNWMFYWGNTSELTWDDPLAANRTWMGAYDVAFYELTVDETLLFEELASNGFDKSVVSAFGVSETHSALVAKNHNEALFVTEAVRKNYHQFSSESVMIGDGMSRHAGKSLFEDIDFVEALTNGFELSKSESIAFVEVMSKSVSFIRKFAETVAIASTVAKTYDIHKYEAFRMVDAWRRAADMVISDIIISTADMTDEDFADFLAYGSSPAYTDWRDFVPGDYEYQEAMFRAVIESKNSDRGLLTGFEVAVDVPDLIDRGSATIVDANAGITIQFSRTFHLVPEITLSTKGGVAGTTLIPELVSATKTSCVVKMKNQNGVYSTGSFTWAAHGY